MKLNMLNYNGSFSTSIILVKKSYLLINYMIRNNNILMFLVHHYDTSLRINCHLKLKESILCSR